MTIAPGDKYIDIYTDTGPVAVPIVSPGVGDKYIEIQTETGPVALKLFPVGVGDKYIEIQTETGPVALALNPTPGPWAWTWTQKNFAPPWNPLIHHQLVCPNGVLVLIGGYDQLLHGTCEVWSSMDRGTTWGLQTDSPGWASRGDHACVVLSDNSIVMMGGKANMYSGSYFNDVWRSTDFGKTWVQMTPSASWAARYTQAAVALSDDSIVLMGGWIDSDLAHQPKDVWISTDKGATWSRQTNSAGFGARSGHVANVFSDDSIILMGHYLGAGYPGDVRSFDVWRSTDRGATWSQITSNAGWGPRELPITGVLKDGSVILFGGDVGASGSGLTLTCDNLWRSTDKGVTWIKYNDSVECQNRSQAAGVVMPDGSLVMASGRRENVSTEEIPLPDVWRGVPSGA